MFWSHSSALDVRHEVIGVGYKRLFKSGYFGACKGRNNELNSFSSLNERRFSATATH